MPSRRPEVEETIKRGIRDIKALDPLITAPKLLDALEKKFHHTLDHRYVARLADKVYKQVRLEADRKGIEQRIVEIRETFRLGRERLMRIVYWNPDYTDLKQPFAEEIVKAVHEMVILDLALLDAELNAGLYRKDEDMIKAEISYKPLPPELREQIVLTFQRWGRLPPREVDKIVGPPLESHAGSATA